MTATIETITIWTPLAALASSAFAQQKSEDHPARPAAAASGADTTDGEVRELDKGAKALTIQHAAIWNLDMAPMTIGLSAEEYGAARQAGARRPGPIQRRAGRRGTRRDHHPGDAVSGGACWTTGRRRAAARLLGAALLVGAGIARAELVDLQWQDGGRFERSMAIAPGKFAELCGPLEPGQRIQWSFQSDRPLNFNIHYHVDKDVVYAAKQDQVGNLQGDLAVVVKQDYCWMWVNKRTTAAKLTVLLTRK